MWVTISIALITNSDFVDARVEKAKGSTIEVIAMCKEAHFSSDQLSALLLLYRSVFLPRLIFNCETWSILTRSEVESLQKNKFKIFKKHDKSSKLDTSCRNIS